MNNDLSGKAYFFQGDALLLPANFSCENVNEGAPLELAKDFQNPDIFEMPSIDGFPSAVVVSVLPETTPPENWKTIPVRQILAMRSAGNNAGSFPGNIVRACHLAQWRQTSRFCGTCGAVNVDGSNTAERHCPKCGRQEFPRICPAIIVLITDDENRILLAHNKKFRAGIYSHVSGFNEAGETLEETVAREVREEVNIEIKDIAYIKSQPWPFPNSLMVGFKARYLSGTVKPDGVEIEDAKWFTKDNLPDLPGEGSLSRFIINDWLSSE